MSSGFNLGNIVSNTLLSSLGGVLGGPIGMIVAQFAQQIFSQILHQVVDQLPIPDSFKGVLHDVVDSQLGGGGAVAQGSPFEMIDQFADAVGLDLGGRAELYQSANDLQQASSDVINQMFASSMVSDSEERAAGASGGAAGRGGWLHAMAAALGKVIDESANAMMSAADSINKDDPKSSANFQVESQLFNLIMQAATTAIKSAGEGMTAAARKQ